VSAPEALILIIGPVPVREWGLADVDPRGPALGAGGGLDEGEDRGAELLGGCRDLIGGDH